MYAFGFVHEAPDVTKVVFATEEPALYEATISPKGTIRPTRTPCFDIAGDYMNAAMQVAQDAEDRCDAITNGSAVLGIIEIAGNGSEADKVRAFVNAYAYPGVTPCDTGSYMGHLAKKRSIADNSAKPTHHEVRVVGDTLLTPTGEQYQPHVVAGHHDVAVLQAARENGMHVALAGPPGSGKTTMAQVAFGKDLITVACDGETSVEDLRGKWLPVPNRPGDFQWHNGPLLVAMLEGRPLLLDELPRASQETQSALLSVLDHRRELRVNENPQIGEGGVVTATEGFVAIVAYNPDSGYGIPEALQDRFSFTIDVPSILDIAAKLEVPDTLVLAARNLETQAANAAKEGKPAPWVPTLRSLLQARDNAKVFGLNFAASALVSACPEEAFRPVLAETLTATTGDLVSALTAAPDAQ